MVVVVGRRLDFVASAVDATFEEIERFFRPDMASNASPVPAFTSCEWETPNNGVSIDEQIHFHEHEQNSQIYTEFESYLLQLSQHVLQQHLAAPYQLR